VTLTVPSSTVPNPIINAALGLNTTGSGTTTIGNTTAGNSVALVSPAVIVNTTGSGSTTIGNAGAGSVALVSPTVTVNSTGTGTTTIGNTSTGGNISVYTSNQLLMQTPTSVLNMVGGTAALYAPTLGINGGATTGNTNIGNTTGTTTFTGTVLGLPGAPTWSTYPATQAITSTAGTDLALTAPAGQNILATSNINMNGPGGVIFNTGGFLGAPGAPCAITAGAGQNLNITAATVGMFANVDMTSKTISNASTVTLTPGASTIAPSTVGGRNYLDIGAPAAISGIPGAVRILGLNGSFTIADNVDVSAGDGKILTLSGGTIAGGLQNYTQLKANGEIYSVAANGASNMLLGNAANGTSISATKVTSNAFGAEIIFNIYNSAATLLRQVYVDAAGFKQTLGLVPVLQPVIQYGRNGAGSGVSGTVTQTLPTAYSDSTYVIQVTMRDAPAAQLYATPLTSSTFTIGWTSAGTGTQTIMWTTFGT
jgi:hypothetical protein